MRSIRGLCVVFILLLCSQHSMAVTVSSAGSAVNAAVEGALEGHLASLGYSTMDAVVLATEAAMSSAAVTAASSYGSGAPWLGVLGELGGGLGLLLTPTPLGDGSLDQWQLNANKTVTVSGNPAAAGGSAAAPTYPALTAGQPYYSVSNSGFGASPDAAFQAYVQYQEGIWASSGITYTIVANGACVVQGAASYSCPYKELSSTGGTISSGTDTASKLASWAGTTCSTGLWYSSGCQSYISPASSTAVTTQTVSPSAAIADIPASDDLLPLSPAVIAALANSLWDQASQSPGYSGVPYSASNPVTSTEASSVESSSSGWPSVGAGAEASSSSSSAGSSPYTIGSATSTGTGTGTGTSTGTGTNTGTTDGTEDLCQLDPSAAACAELGTAGSAALPTSSATVSLSPVSVGGPVGACPGPETFSFMGATYQLAYDPLCQLASGLKPLVLALCGIGAGLIVVLGIKS